MTTTLTWDDGLAERELPSPTVDDVETRIAALNGVDRTLVTIYRGGAHLAVGGSAVDGLVVYCTLDNEMFWQLLGEGEADASITVFAGGQEGSYPASHVTTFGDAVLAARAFLVGGKRAFVGSRSDSVDGASACSCPVRRS